MKDSGVAAEGLTDVKVIFSDTHLGPGHAPGMINPFEDFHHDRELSDLIKFYCTGKYADIPVEVIINGDFLDTLKIPWKGTFPTEVTEEIAVHKVMKCIKGHPQVFDTLRDFLKVPGHTVTYNVGNHDIEVAFPLAQKALKARLDNGDGSSGFSIMVDTEFIRLPMGVLVCHGNGFESMNRIEPGKALKKAPDGQTILDLPLGSQFILECLMPVKIENPIIDHVIPLSSYLLYGLVFESRPTIKLISSMVKFFLKASIFAEHPDKLGFIKKTRLVMDNINMFSDFENHVFSHVKANEEFSTLITGHSHRPMVRRFPGHRTYVNTGTWTRTIMLQLADFGPVNKLTYALVEYPAKGPPSVNLMRWHGTQQVSEVLAS
jgi:UDP-2,3-diacylglucosamine pyrophosphatase LpxH